MDDEDYCVQCLKIDTYEPAVIGDLCAKCAEEMRQSCWNSGSPIYKELYGSE